jgi:hypothetical protein
MAQCSSQPLTVCTSRHPPPISQMSDGWNRSNVTVNVGDYVRFKWPPSSADAVQLVGADWVTVHNSSGAITFGGEFTFRITTPGLNRFKSATKGFRVNVTAVAVGGSRVIDGAAVSGSIVGICTIDHSVDASPNSSFLCYSWGSCACADHVSNAAPSGTTCSMGNKQAGTSFWSLPSFSMNFNPTLVVCVL